MHFLFVDRIEHVVKGRRIRGLKTVSFEEAFLPSPRPVRGEFPRLLLLEAVAQLASWLILYSTDFEKLPLLAKIERVEIGEGAFCGDLLTLEVEIESRDDDGALVKGSVFKEGRRIAEGRNCLCGFGNGTTNVTRVTTPTAPGLCAVQKVGRVPDALLQPLPERSGICREALKLASS